MKTRRISTDIGHGGYVVCEDRACPYKRACASHTTAGDIRSETGFRPLLFRKRTQITCETCLHNGTDLVTSYPAPDSYQQLKLGASHSVRDVVDLGDGAQFTITMPVEVKLVTTSNFKAKDFQESMVIHKAEQIIETALQRCPGVLGIVFGTSITEKD